MIKTTIILLFPFMVIMIIAGIITISSNIETALSFAKGGILVSLGLAFYYAVSSLSIIIVIKLTQ